MAAVARAVRLLGQNGTINATKCVCVTGVRHSNTLAHGLVEKQRKSKLAHDREVDDIQKSPSVSAHDYKYVYPEFLPDPTWWKRDRIREKLERQDMLRRRTVIELPEFYVGSILAVTVSDRYAPGKVNRFVGICIQRGGHGLRAHFTLRNVIDGQGLEIMYEMYNPTIQKVEVLKLEKRLDEELFYLRDVDQEHSTVPFEFEAIPHPPGAPVPVNQIKVKLGPRPWHERWERKDLSGVEPFQVTEKMQRKAELRAEPWEKYDLMKRYRREINTEDTENILGEVHEEMTNIEKRTRKKRMTAAFKK